MRTASTASNSAVNSTLRIASNTKATENILICWYFQRFMTQTQFDLFQTSLMPSKHLPMFPELILANLVIWRVTHRHTLKLIVKFHLPIQWLTRLFFFLGLLKALLSTDRTAVKHTQSPQPSTPLPTAHGEKNHGVAYRLRQTLSIEGVGCIESVDNHIKRRPLADKVLEILQLLEETDQEMAC